VKSLPHVLFYVVSVVLVGLIFFILLLAVSEMLVHGNIGDPTGDYVYKRYVYRGTEECGGLNLVSNILIDYRGYDTLLESTVLFAAVVSIMLVWGTRSTGQKEKEKEVDH